MIENFLPYIKQLLSSCGFRIGAVPVKHYRELLTALHDLSEQQIVWIPSLIELAQSLPGKLILDDTIIPKYGLKQFAQALRIPSTGGTVLAFKMLLFLWQVSPVRIPLGFSLWHQQTPKISELALAGLSQLRNWFGLKPECVLWDAAFPTDEITKRLTDYGWPIVMRSKKNRKINGRQVHQVISRGYGEECGYLENGVKVKMVRRKNFFILSNRLLATSAELIGLYRNRWKIEEVFRVFKSCIGLSGCQQHSMQSQAVYLMVCFLVFACVEIDSEGFPYETFHQVIFGH